MALISSHSNVLAITLALLDNSTIKPSFQLRLVMYRERGPVAARVHGLTLISLNPSENI